MIKRSYILGLLVAVLLFNGCVSKSVPVNTKDSDITSNKEKGYIIFSRPWNLAGGVLSINLMEFNPKTFEPKLIAVLESGEKIIYSVEEGNHYFFTSSGASLNGNYKENIEMINISKGKILYVDVGFRGDGLAQLLFPIVTKEKRIDLKNKLEKSECSKKILNQFVFNIEENNPTPNIYYSPIQMTIECEKGKIKEVVDRYNKNDIKLLQEQKTVLPSDSAIQAFELDKQEFTKSIKEEFSVWNTKYKNIPITEAPFLFVESEIPEDYHGKFDAINLNNNTINKNIDQDFLLEITSDLSKKMEVKNQGLKKLNVNFAVNNYDSGSMAKRYLMGGVTNTSPSFGVIDVTVVFTDENNKYIGEVRLTEIEAGGILGGINTLKSDVVAIISEYTKRNLLRE